jgi:hypothetical protein
MQTEFRTRRGLRVLTALTSCTVAAGLALPILQSPAQAAAPTPTQAAKRGAGWLARQITAKGGHLESFGNPDVPDTAYAVIALHAAGVGATQSSQALAYLKTQLGAGLQTSGHDDAGRLAYFILAVVASGKDPRAFGGSGAQNNLVQRLLNSGRATGADKGLFGAQDPTFDGAFRQGFALAALKAANVASSNAQVAAGIAWLENQQCTSGLWVSYRSNPATACPAADPGTFTGPDTNSTGSAVQGLAAWGQRPRSKKVLGQLHQVQSSDGGFPYLATTGQASDPNSTALSIQAILAEGGNPASGWAVAGKTPFTALISYQLGCSDPAANRGAFFFPGSRDPSVFATVQSVSAAASKTFPLPASTPSTAVPTVPCP